MCDLHEMAEHVLRESAVGLMQEGESFDDIVRVLGLTHDDDIEIVREVFNPVGEVDHD